MRNASGELTNDLAELLEIWAQHAKSLYEDSAERTETAATTTETRVTAAGADTGTTMQRARCGSFECRRNQMGRECLHYGAPENE